MTTPSIRERGRWSDMSVADRADLTTRGIGRIFDPELRASVLAILEDVRDHGDVRQGGGGCRRHPCLS